MSEFTNIEWCDATLNLWWGCTKVSDGCKFCYAEHLADHRHKKGNLGPTGTRKEVKSWRSTLNKISKRAKSEGRRLRVFCQSMSDTFEGPETMGGVECFEVDWNQSCTVPFDFDLLEETPEQELARRKKPRAIDSRAVLLSTLEEIAGWLRKPSGCARTAVQERQKYLAVVEKVLAQHTTRK